MPAAAASVAHMNSAYDQGEGFLAWLSAMFGVGGGLVALAFYVVIVIGFWRTFSKAGIPGILAIIPIVNLFCLLKIARMSFWFILLYLVPIANVVLAIVVAVKVGRNFGHGGAFSFFLLWLFPIIGYLIVGFSNDRFEPVEARPAY